MPAHFKISVISNTSLHPYIKQKIGFETSEFVNCFVVRFRYNIHRSHITYNIVPLIFLLESYTGGLYQMTGELFFLWTKLVARLTS